MRHLVTGGAGFVGSHLVERLLKRGDEVVVLDNLHTGSRDNLVEVQVGAGAAPSFFVGDVCDPFYFEVDQIWALACPASPPRYQRDPVRTLKTCFLGALHALELARELGARMLFASTSEVYGDAEKSPQSEDYWGNVNPVGVRGCYDNGKRVAETLCADFARRHGVDVRIARIFNTYGPRMARDDGRMIPNFVKQSLAGEPLTVYGDGQQTRSLCYVDDLVDGLAALMDSDGPLKGAPINLGNPEERTVLAIADAVTQACRGEATATIRVMALPEDDPRQRRPSIKRAWDLLRWAPKVHFVDGLQRTVAWWKEYPW